MVRSVLSNTQHLLQNLFAASCCQLVVKPQKISRQTNTLRLSSCSNFWHSCFLPSKCLSCFCQALSLSLSAHACPSVVGRLAAHARKILGGKHRSLPLPSLLVRTCSDDRALLDTGVNGSQYHKTCPRQTHKETTQERGAAVRVGGGGAEQESKTTISDRWHVTEHSFLFEALIPQAGSTVRSIKLLAHTLRV